MIVIHVNNNECFVYDSFGKNSIYFNDIKSIIEDWYIKLRMRRNLNVIDLKYIQKIQSVEQKDGYSCGLFVMYYSEKYYSNPTISVQSIVEYRQNLIKRLYPNISMDTNIKKNSRRLKNYEFNVYENSFIFLILNIIFIRDVIITDNTSNLLLSLQQLLISENLAKEINKLPQISINCFLKELEKNTPIFQIEKYTIMKCNKCGIDEINIETNFEIKLIVGDSVQKSIGEYFHNKQENCCSEWINIPQLITNFPQILILQILNKEEVIIEKTSIIYF